MEEIYRGQFVSRDEVVWTVSLLHRGGDPSGVPGELCFAATEPLLIEWPEQPKEAVLCGSRATLTLLSPGDRTYIDLYSEVPGEIMLEVFKDGGLYWTGSLDPEFYEEPYSTLSDYEVRLTFSDLGMLGRVRYELEGIQTLRSVLDSCVSAGGLTRLSVDEQYISTRITPGGEPLSLSDLSVWSENFYDEDGEALLLSEVLEGMFQPLGLRVTQRGGRLWVYDLNGLYTLGTRRKVEWMSDDQLLGVDRVYSAVKITLSPYVKSGHLGPSECWTQPTDADATALQSIEGVERDGCVLWSYHYSVDLSLWLDATDCGFTLWTSEEGEGAELVDSAVRFFKLVPQEDGSPSEGVAVLWPGVAGRENASGARVGWKLFGRKWSFVTQANAPGPDGARTGGGGVLWRSARMWLPPVGEGGALRLHVSLNMLMDCRFNPFEGAVSLLGSDTSSVDQKGWYDEWAYVGNLVYVPVTLKWQPEGTGQVYVWRNDEVVGRPLDRPVLTLGDTLGHWEVYDQHSDQDPWQYGYLCWYDAEDRAGKTGVLGWKKNRPAINPHTDRLLTGLSGVGEGQYVPYPVAGSRGGRVWLEIRSSGWMVCDGGVKPEKLFGNRHGLWDATTQNGGKTWWCLMELPEISVVTSSRYAPSLCTDDVEYSGELNASAREALSIETICGTVAGGLPLSRGVYFRSVSLSPLEELTRGGRTSQAEVLLLGTLYSQYARRKTKLSGTTELPCAGLCVYSEAMQGGKVFLLAGASEDAVSGTSESVLVELRPDEYSVEEEQ